MSPKLDPPPPPLPPVDPTPLVSPLHHTNPFCRSQSTSPPMSPCNPFFPLAQQNPFYEDMLTSTPLNSSLPPLPYLSSSRPPISQLFPHSRKEARPLPPVPTEEEKPFSKKSANPFTTAAELDSEWDESFEAFAAGRLQSPEDPATDCKTQRNTPGDHPLERCSNEGAPFFMSGADQNTNVNETLLHHHHHQQTCTDFTFKPNTNTHHFDTFAQFLETIPEHTSFESENTTLTLTNHTNFTDTVDANLHQNSSTKLNSASPDPVSSGLGSSTEEDFLSCLSSYSDKFSASSSEEAEAQNFEGNLFSFEKPKRSHPSEAEDDFTDRSGDLSLDELEQRTVIQEDSGNEMEEDTRVPNLAEHQNQATKLIPTSNIGNSEDTMDRTTSEGEDVAHKPNVSQGSVGFDVSLVDFTPGSLSDPHRPPPPSLHIITSSPDQSKASPESRDTRLELLSTSAITSSPSQGIDDTLLRSSLSDKSNSSFSQSFYVSADSQPYQTCASESNEMLTIIGEQSGSETTSDASGQQVDSSKTSVEGNYVKDGLKESVNGTLTKGSDLGLETLSLEVSSGVSNNKIAPIQSKGDSFDILPEAITDANPGLESQGPSLQRSRSEGNPVPAFDKKLPSSLSGKSNGSFQTICVSIDSLPNQTGVLESNETPRIVGELSGSETTSDASCQQSNPSRTSGEQICVKDGLRESIIRTSKNVSDTSLVASNSNTSNDPKQFDISSNLDKVQSPKGDGLEVLFKENETPTKQSGSETTSDTSCQRGDASKTPGEGIYFMDGLGGSTSGTWSLEAFPQESNSNTRNDLRQLDVSTDLSTKQSYTVSVGVSNNRIDPERSQKDQVQKPKGDDLDVLPKENGTLTEQSGGETTSDTSCQRGDSSKTLGEEIRLMDGLGDSISRTSKEGSELAEAPNSNTSNDLRQLDVSSEWSVYQSYEVSVGVSNNRIDPERSQKNQVQRPKGDCLDVLPKDNGTPTIVSEWSGSKTPGEEICSKDGLGESIGGTVMKVSNANANRVWNNTTNPEMDPNNGFDFLPEALTDANPGLESQDAILAPPLQRSHSEGAITPAFDDLLLPSFGSDPGAIQESSPSPPTPDPPSLTPFPSSLTSDRSSPPVALSPLPLCHESSPSGVARAAAPTPPKPAGSNQDAEENSPHPVKPLNTATPAEEKRTEGRSVLEKLKSTIHPGRSSQVSEQETERKKSLTEGAGSYYHLNHSELVALLVQREAELQRQKAEFERQKVLLAKREVELKKLKPQVKDLEDYIDTLLVRIMEQKPTLLQVRSKLK